MASPILGEQRIDRPQLTPFASHARLALRSAWKPATFALIGLLLSSCAIYYRDRDTGAEHIWGFGHLSVKTLPPNEGKQALVQRMTLTGIAVGMDNGSLGVSAGYDRREHILVFDENAAMTIERHPSNDFFNFKIRTHPPTLETTHDTTNGAEQKETPQ
jgi:hypothetical protein